MGTLSVVATPIGNLEDITLRALTVLAQADTIVCEDTRVTGKLLARHKIETPMLAYPADDRDDIVERVLNLLEDNQHIALVTDAGTPAISDPGAVLVARARVAGARVEVIPGPSALTAAMSAAGLLTHRFTFFGFPPHKKGRASFFKELLDTSGVSVFFESPHRIEKSLQSLAELAPSRHIVLCRELTKLHEEVRAGRAAELAEAPPEARGEFVVCVAPEGTSAVY